MSTNQSGFDRRTLLRSAAGLSALGIPGVVGGATATRPNQSTGGSNQHCDQTVEAGESIQAAINAADDGDTICIEAGAYEEDLNITRADSLTIRGAGSDEVTIDASGESGYGVDGVFSSGDWGAMVRSRGSPSLGPNRVQSHRTSVSSSRTSMGSISRMYM